MHDRGNLHEKRPLQRLETLIDENDWRGPNENNLPARPVQRHDAENALQKRRVQQEEVQRHGETDCVDENHVFPQGEREEGFRRREGVHCVEHFYYHEDGERDCRGGAGGCVGEDGAGSAACEEGAGVEVRLLGLLVD